MIPTNRPRTLPLRRLAWAIAVLPLSLTGLATDALAVSNLSIGGNCLGRQSSTGPISGLPMIQLGDDIQASSDTFGQGCATGAFAEYGYLEASAGVVLVDSEFTSVDSRWVANFREEAFRVEFVGPVPSGDLTILFEWEHFAIPTGFRGPDPEGVGIWRSESSTTVSVFHDGQIERFRALGGVTSTGDVVDTVSDPSEEIDFDPTLPFTITGSLTTRALHTGPSPSGIPVTGQTRIGALTALVAIDVLENGVPVDPALWFISDGSGLLTVPEPGFAALLGISSLTLAATGRTGRRSRNARSDRR